MRLQVVALERCFPELEVATLLILGNNATQTFFDKSPKGRPLPVSQLSGFLEKPIWYLYGSFHVATYIIMERQDVNTNFMDLMKDDAPDIIMI